MTNKEKWCDRFEIYIPLIISAISFGFLPICVLYGIAKNSVFHMFLALLLLVVITFSACGICQIISAILKKNIDKNN